MTANIGVWRRLPIPLAILTDIIAIEKPNATADGQGGYVNSWSTIAMNVRAVVQDTSPPPAFMGGEMMELGAQGEHVTHRIWIRFAVAGLDATCNVLYNGKRFRIHDVGNYGGNTLIQAEEIRQ